jgi:hypothetical protein
MMVAFKTFKTALKPGKCNHFFPGVETPGYANATEFRIETPAMETQPIPGVETPGHGNANEIRIEIPTMEMQPNSWR